MNSPNPSTGRPESPQSNETFPKRTAKPGDTGLANEARPGLGSRDDGMKPLPKGGSKPSPHDQEPLGRNAPLAEREPREQKSDPARDAERDTGVSGHSSGD